MRFWFVTVTDNPIYLGVKDREEFIEEHELKAETYLVLADTSTSATRKAIVEFQKEHMRGRDIRFGALPTALYLEVCRTTRKEMKSWQEMEKKILM